MLLCGLFNFGWAVFILHDGLIRMEFGWEGTAIRNPALYRLTAPARHSGPPLRGPRAAPPEKKPASVKRRAKTPVPEQGGSRDSSYTVPACEGATDWDGALTSMKAGVTYETIGNGGVACSRNTSC
jgi:hypothetical protein